MKNVNLSTRIALSRRAFLRGSCITLALPLLTAMEPALTAVPKPPMRFIGILNYFSFHTPFLYPTEAGADYTSTPYLDILQPHRQDFSLISGLHHPDVRAEHDSDKSYFTGAPHPGSPAFRNTISLDQLAAEKLGQQTRHASLNFAPIPSRSCSYTRSGVAIPPETSAARAFAKLFIDGTPAEITHEVARIKESRSILDRIASDAKRLQLDLGASDRDKLDQYFTSVRELEKRLVITEQYVTQPKPKPTVRVIDDPGSGEDTAHFGLMLDVARLAVQTDLTRIVTLYYVGTKKTPSAPDTTFDYHPLSHHGLVRGKIDQLAILERDILVEWGQFLQRLKETREGGSRLLDNTITVLGASLGNASSHDATNLPVLIAGGRFRHGRYIAHNPKDPPPLSNLWVQILNQMGVEVDHFGTSNRKTMAGLEST
ncbi:MAG: DUF1552 domain-containing protein [Planctomycetes bacterium]|nr:DUF1552 domain-containing protein [Planctomycetota bacterium]